MRRKYFSAKHGDTYGTPGQKPGFMTMPDPYSENEQGMGPHALRVREWWLRRGVPDEVADQAAQLAFSDEQAYQKLRREWQWKVGKMAR